MELNWTIKETHCLQSSQSVLLHVFEKEFNHFIESHWIPLQVIVQHTRVHLPCTCPLHLAASRPSPSPASSSCPLPHQQPDSGSGEGSDHFVTAEEDGPGSPSSVLPLISHLPLVSHSSTISHSPSSIPTLFHGWRVFIWGHTAWSTLLSMEPSLDDEDESHSGGEVDCSS